jgi:hypothetical protein
MADDDDTTPGSGPPPPPEDPTRRRGGRRPGPEEDAPSEGSRSHEDDTLPVDGDQAEPPPGRGGPDDEHEDYLPPTGAHEIVFTDDDAEEERLSDHIPSFEEYRRAREESVADASGSRWGAEEPSGGHYGEAEEERGGEPSPPDVGEPGYAERMFAGAREHDDDAVHEDGGDTLDGEQSLEGISLPDDDEAGAASFESVYEEELAREAADVFPTGYEHTAEEIHQRRLEAHRRHRRNGRIRLLILVVVVALVAFAAVHELGGSSAPSKPPRKGPSTPTSAGTGKGFLRKGSDPSVLPGNLLIADWGSRKLLVISPQGQIVWSYQPQASYLQALNPDSAFFTSSGKQIVIAEESHSKVVVLTVSGRKLFYTFGHYDKSGKGKNYLDDPSSAIEEAGEVLVSDLVNCRVIAVKPPSHAIVASIGHTGACEHDPPKKLDEPWSAYPLSDGGTVVTELGDGRVDLLSAAGKLTASFTVPGLGHPVNVNETRSGDLIGVDHTNPGAVEIFTDTGQVVWTYRKRTGDGALLDPAIAYVLPDGDVLVSDEYNDRVIVIDRKSKRIVWQYGRRHVAGGGKGYLDVPVGLDLVPPHSLLDQFPHATPPR